MTNGSRTWRKRRGRCRATSRSACDPPQNLAGRKSWRSVGSHPTCQCSSLSGLPTNCSAPFSILPESLTTFTVHLRVHPSAFHSHFFSAHNTGTVFLKFFLWITFSSAFLTMEPSQEPSFLSQMMMGSSSSLPLFIVPHSISNSTQIQERLGRRFYSISWWICLRRSFLPIAWTTWHSSSGKKFYWGLRRHFHWPLRALGLKFSPKYTKCRRNLISWNRSMENLAQVNANGHGLNNV